MLKKILMLTVLFTIIISFNLIGANAANLTIPNTDSYNGATITDSTVIIQLENTDSAGTDITVASPIIVGSSVKKIIVYADEHAGEKIGLSGKNLFDYTHTSKLVRVETYIGNENARINSPSGFREYKYKNSNATYGDGLVFQKTNQSAIYINNSGWTLYDTGAEAIAGIVSTTGNLYIDEPVKSNTIALGPIKKTIKIIGTNPSSDQTVIKTSFTIETDDDTEYTVTLPSNVRNTSDGVYTVDDDGNKIYYRTGYVAASAVDGDSEDDIIYVQGAGPHVFGIAGTDDVISKNLYIKGTSSVEDYNKVQLAFKDPDVFSKIKVTLGGGAYSADSPYTKSDTGNTHYHYKEKSIAKYVSAGADIYHDGSSCDLGTIEKSLELFGNGSTAFTFNMLDSTDITVDVHYGTKTGSGYYINYPDKNPVHQNYYSKLSSAIKKAYTRFDHKLSFNSNSSAIYNLGSITSDLVISGNATVSYTDISATLRVKNGAQVSGAVYLKDEDTYVYYSNVSDAIEKLQSSSALDYSVDGILHITGSGSKVHSLGTISEPISVQGHMVQGKKAEIKYTKISSGASLQLIGDEVISNGGAYKPGTHSGSGLATRTYFGSLKDAYDASTDDDDINDDGDGTKVVYLDESTSAYDLSCGGQRTNWDGWTVKGDDGVTINILNIDFNTLATDLDVESTRGQYLVYDYPHATGADGTVDRVYYQSESKALQAFDSVTPQGKYADTIYIDEDDTYTYNFGNIDRDIIVRGKAKVKYTEIENTYTLTLDEDTTLYEDLNNFYLEGSNDDKIYYHDRSTTLAAAYAGQTLCAESDIDLSGVTDNLTVKGIGSSAIYVSYDSIVDNRTLTIKGTAVHKNNTDGVYIVDDDADSRIYYGSELQAVAHIYGTGSFTTTVADDTIWFEKKSGSTPYDLGTIDGNATITCRPDYKHDDEIDIQFALSGAGSIRILKKDVEKDMIKVVDQGHSSTYSDSTPDVETLIYCSTSGKESFTYFSSIEQAISEYKTDSDYSTSNSILMLEPDATADSIGTEIDITKSIIIMGIGEDEDDEDEPDNPTKMPALNITANNVALYNLMFEYDFDVSGNNYAINIADLKNIAIEECTFANTANGINATGVINSDIINNEFKNTVTGHGIQLDLNVDDKNDIVGNTFFNPNEPDINIPQSLSSDEDDEKAELQYISLLKYGNKHSSNNYAIVYVGGSVPSGVGNYFLSFLKLDGEDVYEYGTSDYYTIVAPTKSSILIEAEVDDADSHIGGKERYSKRVSLDIDKFTEVSFTCVDEEDNSNTYTVNIYRKSSSSSAISRTVFDDEELDDVIHLISNMGGSTSYTSGIIYEASSKNELTISKDNFNELKENNTDITLNLGNGFMVIDVSKIPEVTSGTGLKFITSTPSGTISSPNSSETVLKRVDLKIVQLPTLEELDVTNVVSGISTSGIDFDDYDSSTLKVYYYKPVGTSGTFTKISSSEYYVAEEYVKFTAPHYSQYVLTAQEATAESNKLSLTATVIDTDDDPLSGYTVKIDSSTRTTNSAGEVTFSALDSSSGSLQILDDDNESVFTGTYSITTGTSNTWSASNDKLVITRTSDVTTLDVLFEYVSSSNINITDVDFYSNPKTGFPFFTSTAGYITIGLILAVLIGLGFFVRKKFFIKQA